MTCRGGKLTKKNTQKNFGRSDGKNSDEHFSVGREIFGRSDGRKFFGRIVYQGDKKKCLKRRRMS